jgi:hypothetical protein
MPEDSQDSMRSLMNLKGKSANTLAAGAALL